MPADNVAFRSTDQMLVGVDADVTGNADLSLDATATTVGDGSGADVATASSGSAATENIGLGLDGGTTTIGRDGRLVGLAGADHERRGHRHDRRRRC